MRTFDPDFRFTQVGCSLGPFDSLGAQVHLPVRFSGVPTPGGCRFDIPSSGPRSEGQAARAQGRRGSPSESPALPPPPSLRSLGLLLVKGPFAEGLFGGVPSFRRLPGPRPDGARGSGAIVSNLWRSFEKVLLCAAAATRISKRRGRVRRGAEGLATLRGRHGRARGMSPGRPLPWRPGCAQGAGGPRVKGRCSGFFGAGRASGRAPSAPGRTLPGRVPGRAGPGSLARALLPPCFNGRRSTRSRFKVSGLRLPATKQREVRPILLLYPAGCGGGGRAGGGRRGRGQGRGGREGPWREAEREGPRRAAAGRARRAGKAGGENPFPFRGWRFSQTVAAWPWGLPGEGGAAGGVLRKEGPGITLESGPHWGLSLLLATEDLVGRPPLPTRSRPLSGEARVHSESPPERARGWGRLRVSALVPMTRARGVLTVSTGPQCQKTFSLDPVDGPKCLPLRLRFLSGVSKPCVTLILD